LVEDFFASQQAPEDDLYFFRQRWMPGTCEWILSNPTFKLWLEDASNARIAWLNAPPASGKSILSAYIINHLRDLDLDCQYFFFKFADQTKQSMTTLLRSLGLQMTKVIPVYRQEIAKLSREGVTLEKKDARFIWRRIFTTLLSRIALSRPLYWVIDALDEAETPKLLLELLQTFSTSGTPIRILVISRQTEALSIGFDRLSARISVDTIRWDSQEDATLDIQVYIENELRYMRGTEYMQAQVKRSILDRADGNFLWVHLVVEEILACHTQEAISHTLEAVPTGMNAMYQRMEATMAHDTKEADQLLARALLAWVVCAHHPLTMQEISQALTPEFPEFLDLKRTILEVCGQFLVVDRNAHVVMVHKTARDYLTSTGSVHYYIDEKASHKKLFLKTVSWLLRPDLSSKLGPTEKGIHSATPFMLYAANFFTYHLRQAATTSEEIMDKLVSFFKAPSVLSWIYILASSQRIQVLVTAAGALTWFAGLNRKLNVEKNPLLHRVQDLELYDTWAIDLMKIVAKFGRYLLDDPSSIYKIIPPLCPQNSAVFRQFAHTGLSALSIHGISNAIWNDCLASLSLRHGAKAWKISCAGRHIAVLSSTGSIVLWDSTHFEEVCTMRHAELVTQMCFNSRCDNLVSYGFKTTKIWAIPSGQLIANVPNPANSKALTITFAEHDTKVVIGSDDKMIRELCIDDLEKGWHTRDHNLLEEKSAVQGGIITSPAYMVFNSDASRIAVAYRGYPLSIWDTIEPRLIGRCKRVAKHRPDDGRPSTNWMAVDRVAWSPVSDYLVGLYKDGSIFKWNPIDDDNQEVAMIADEIHVSPDGKLFLTSDSNGTVKIWNFHYFSVIYQLSSENLVVDFAFSPDCKRFYDLRGASINAWEPNSLIRASENNEGASDTASDYQTSTSITQISEAWVLSIDPIIALAAAPKSMLYCVSHENGSVNLLDKTEGNLMEIAKFSAFLTVDFLSWDEDGRHVAIADVGGNIVVKRLDPPNPKAEVSSFNPRSLFAGKAKIPVGGIHQILLNQGSTRLLVISQDLGQVWSVGAGIIECTAALAKGETRRWTNHPLKKTLLLGVGPRDLKIISWEDLTEKASLDFEDECFHVGGRPSFDTEEFPGTPISRLPLHPDTELAVKSQVSRAILTQDGRHLLVQLSRTVGQARSLKTLLVFEITLLGYPTGARQPTALRPLEISAMVSNKIEVPLDILSGGTLVFLDKDLWMCTVELKSVTQHSTVRRHYFIPRDWANTESLEQCCLLGDGTFLCPKDGEVAVISSSLGVAG